MKLFPYIENIGKSHSKLVTGFVHDYFLWADKEQDNKPFFYGKWSLKWALHIILPQLDTNEQRNLIHHVLTELYTVNEPKNITQFQAIKLMALRPWKQQLNDMKKEVDIKTLPFIVTASGYKIVQNDSSHNLNSLIFRRTNADVVVSFNPETKAAAVSFRSNSKINQLKDFKLYLLNKLKQSEDGWKTLGDNSVLINHGIQTKTPSIHTTKSVTNLLTQYLDD